MKKILFALLIVVSALGASSCKYDPDLPYPATEEFPLVFTSFTTAQSTAKLADAQGTGNQTVSFDITEVKGDVSKVEALEIRKQFIGFNVPPVTTPVTNPTLGIGGPVQVIRTVSLEPQTIQIPINDLVAGLTRASGPTQGGTRVPLTRASLRANESFRLTFVYVLKDGRRIDFAPAFLNAPLGGSIGIVP